MQQIDMDSSLKEAIAPRLAEFFVESRQKHFKHFDRLFIKLMIIQWLVAIFFALWLSPKTWIGQSSQTHLHVWAAIFLGSAIVIPAAIAIVKTPAKTSEVTPHVDPTSNARTARPRVSRRRNPAPSAKKCRSNPAKRAPAPTRTRPIDASVISAIAIKYSRGRVRARR